MAGSIAPRYGVDVYTSDVGNICIAQEQAGEGELVVILHPDEAKTLIKMLEEEIRLAGQA
jgi:hypothetical protein